MTVEIRTYKKADLSRIENKNPITIWKQTDKYIPVKVYNSTGNISQKGYQLRYIKREEVEKYIKEQDSIEHKWSQKKEMKKEVTKEQWDKLWKKLGDILNDLARKDWFFDD